MQRVLKPLAKSYGLRGSKEMRFMEQMYTAIYFGVLGPFGLWVMWRGPVWYFDVNGVCILFSLLLLPGAHLFGSLQST